MTRKHPELISELTLVVFSSHFFNEFEELAKLLASEEHWANPETL